MTEHADVSTRRSKAVTGRLGAGALLSLLLAPAMAAAQAAAPVAAASAPLGFD